MASSSISSLSGAVLPAHCRKVYLSVAFTPHSTNGTFISTIATATTNKIPATKNPQAKLGILPVKDEKNIAVNFHVYGSLMEACANMKSLAEVRKVHGHMLLSGLETDMPLRTKLVSMYAMGGSLADARLIFDKIEKPTVFLCNVMIRGYANNGLCEEAMRLYYQMHATGMRPDNFTFPFVLKACAGVSALKEGMEIHDCIIKRGLGTDVFVGNALVSLYAKCGCVQEARQVFDKMSERDVVSWNSMIGGYAQNGRCEEALKLFDHMELTGVNPNSVTLVIVLPVFATLEALQRGEEIHDYITRSGFESHISVENALIDMYAKCGVTETARRVFDKMSKRNVVSWNSMISGYAQKGECNEALKIFRQMQMAGMKPDSITVASILPACAHLAALGQGREIHSYIIRSGFECEIFVGNSLIDMYSKCGRIEDACKVFYKLNERNVVSWSAMIAGYVQNGLDEKALNLFRQIPLLGMTMNSVTITNVLPACAHLAALQQGKEIHGYVLRTGFESDIFVGNALIDMYAKCGSIEVARNVFDKMLERDIVSSNVMIAGYSLNCQYTEALQLFCQMELAGVKSDSVTIVSILLACARLSALQQGKEIHDYIIRRGFQSYLFVVNALIDMYIKCGNIDAGRLLFDKTSQRDVGLWNTMILGYGMQGHGEEALMLFQQMRQAEIKPDHITFIAVLSACSHAGLVDEGWKYFDLMCRGCITPKEEHYACMVDLLGRAGRLNEAQDFINKMPSEPDANVWGALLGACRIHCNIELGEHVAERLFELEPENAGYYVLMSNIYAAAGKWDDVTKVRTMMKRKGLKKNPGCSWIEVNNRIHAFFAGDTLHPQLEEIYADVKSLAGRMQEFVYVPETRFLLLDGE